MPTFTVITRDAQPYLYVAKRPDNTPAAISDAMGAAFQTVGAFMARHGLTAAGSPMSVYTSFDLDDVAFRSGFSVGDGERAKECLEADSGAEIGFDVLPSGRTLRVEHTGPYSALSETYAALMAYVAEHGLTLATPTWEVYVDDPGETPEPDLRTEIFAGLTSEETA